MAFLTSKSALAKIETLEARVEELETDAVTRDEHVGNLETGITERDATIAENAVTISGLEAAAATAATQLATANSELATATAELATFDDRIESGVLAKFESLGGQPIPATTASNADAPKGSILSQFAAIESQAEKMQFFRDNKTALKAAEIAARK